MITKYLNPRCLYPVIVAAVSYLNTIPFVWAVEQVTLGVCASGLPDDVGLDLRLAVPSECARLCQSGEVDVALVPVAVVPFLKNTKIITDFCISAEGAVDTVALLTNCDKIEDVKTIYLDCDSRTSVELVKILAQKWWGIEPLWSNGIVDNVGQGEAILAIGDKVFELQKRFETKIDLAIEWQKMTGLPFVFAVWVACTEVGLKYESQLNQILKHGVNNIDKAVQKYANDVDQAKVYLTTNIKFNMSDKKREALELFWQHINPG